MNKTLQTKITVNGLYDATMLEPFFWLSGVFKGTFVSGLPGLLGLAVYLQWSRYL